MGYGRLLWTSGHQLGGPLCWQGLSAHIARNAAWFPRAIAVTPLIYAAATVGLPSLAIYATVLFVVAAGGGVPMNLGYHWKKR